MIIILNMHDVVLADGYISSPACFLDVPGSFKSHICVAVLPEAVSAAL